MLVRPATTFWSLKYIGKSEELRAYYADVAARCGAAYLDPTGFVETCGTDELHYTARGHAVMAERVERKIHALLEA